MDGGIKMENNLNIFILDMKNSIEREDNLVLHDDEMIGLVKVLENHSGKAKDTYTETMKLFKIVKEFDNLKEEDKIRTLIHELMHVPKSFGGGFKYHDYVCEKNVEIEYQKYINLKKRKESLERYY